jgi:hypothetical protein
VNQEAGNEHSKPVLDAESFQRLLAAAYVLQSQDHHRHPSLQPIAQPKLNPFIQGAIVQKRSPSLRLSGAMRNAKAVTKITRLMLWKRVEAFSIAVVFCAMIGMSIHRLSALPGRASRLPGILQQESSQLAEPLPGVLAASQESTATEKSRQSMDGSESDVVGDDLIIHYRPFSKNVTSRPRNQSKFGHDAEMLADTVVRYGPDVTMWSRSVSGSSSHPKIRD